MCVLTLAFSQNRSLGCDIHFISYGFDITAFSVVEFNYKINKNKSSESHACEYFSFPYEYLIRFISQNNLAHGFSLSDAQW